MALENRGTGWLNTKHHLEVRELLLHSLSRENLICPVYCLMPDHAHFLFGGLSHSSDQLNAIKHFRRSWSHLLKKVDLKFSLQKQAYDHVLTDSEKQSDSFESIAGYILENPVRGGLVQNFREWEYFGSLAVGFTGLDVREECFWDRLWRIYYSCLED